jgi:hypothetical protein
MKLGTMNIGSIVATAAFLVPAAVAAQVDPLERLAEVLPPDVAEQVLVRVESARSRDLPAQAMANLALEGVAKGRSAAEVLAAVELLGADMGRAQEALQAAGHAPGEGEIEAGTAALRMGVDGAAISELARSGPSGRSLAVPLLVLGGLAERGLPADQALAAVRDRLQARADDSALLGAFPDVARGLGAGMRPDQVGTALAGGLAGFEVPVAGVQVPVGPQTDRGRAPEGRGGGPPDGVPSPPGS